GLHLRLALGLFPRLGLFLVLVGEAVQIGEQRIGEAVLLRLRFGRRLCGLRRRGGRLRLLALLALGLARRLLLCLARCLLFFALLLLRLALRLLFLLARGFLFLALLALRAALFFVLALFRLALGLQLGLRFLLDLDLGFRGLQRRVARRLDLRFGRGVGFGFRLSVFVLLLLRLGAQLRFHLRARLRLGFLFQAVALDLRLC